MSPILVKVCITGHEWAKRQANKASIEFEALDNYLSPLQGHGNSDYRGD